MLLLLPTLCDRPILIHRVGDILTPLLAVLQLIHDNIVFVVVLGRRQVLAKEWVISETIYLPHVAETLHFYYL